MRKNYTVTTMENFTTHDVVYIYDTPSGDTTESSNIKEKSFKSLLDKGYVVTSILKCDQEVYLNHRLNEKVRNYLLNEKGIQVLESKRGTFPEEVYWESRCLAIEYRNSTLKSISRSVRRIKKSGYKVFNPQAVKLAEKHL